MRAIPLNVNNLLIKDFINYESIRLSGKDILEIELKLISYFTEISITILEDLSFNELDKYLTSIRALLKTQPNTKRRKVIRVNGVRYSSPNDENDFRTNQYTAYSQYDTKPIENLHKKLSVIYAVTPMFKKYKFNPESVNEIAANIYHNGKVGQVFGTLFFYTQRFEQLNLISQVYLLMAEETIKEQMIEIYQELPKLGVNTDGTPQSIISQMETLLKKMN